MQIDQHTLPEVQELFAGWSEHTPTNILVKALVKGLGGEVNAPPAVSQEIPQHVFDAMQNSALAGIAAKAGPRLPITRGKDAGLPKSSPVFDFDELRERNKDVLRRRAKK
jgi:hypothetical protein